MLAAFASCTLIYPCARYTDVVCCTGGRLPPKHPRTLPEGQRSTQRSAARRARSGNGRDHADRCELLVSFQKTGTFVSTVRRASQTHTLILSYDDDTVAQESTASSSLVR
eukprot:6181393-Pleurochrysis_carterae.AAC.2